MHGQRNIKLSDIMFMISLEYCYTLTILFTWYPQTRHT